MVFCNAEGSRSGLCTITVFTHDQKIKTNVVLFTQRERDAPVPHGAEGAEGAWPVDSLLGVISLLQK